VLIAQVVVTPTTIRLYPGMTNCSMVKRLLRMKYTLEKKRAEGGNQISIAKSRDTSNIHPTTKREVRKDSKISEKTERHIITNIVENIINRETYHHQYSRKYNNQRDMSSPI
jgi:hypothetical protein